MQRSLLLTVVALLAIALFAIPSSRTARAATTDDFMVRTTADLVGLCGTAPGQENYVAAVHFCQGFASGAYQYYLAMAHHNPADRYVCPPDPLPSRDEVVASYVRWARANTSAMGEPAVESLFRYLSATYPCSDAQRAPANR